MHADHHARAHARLAVVKQLQETVEAVFRVLDRSLGRAANFRIQLVLGRSRFFSTAFAGLWLVEVSFGRRHQADDVRARDLVAFAVEIIQLET